MLEKLKQIKVLYVENEESVREITHMFLSNLFDNVDTSARL